MSSVRIRIKVLCEVISQLKALQEELPRLLLISNPLWSLPEFLWRIPARCLQEIVGGDRIDDLAPLLPSDVAPRVEYVLLRHTLPNADQTVRQSAHVHEAARDAEPAHGVAQMCGIGCHHDASHAHRRDAPLVDVVRGPAQQLVLIWPGVSWKNLLESAGEALSYLVWRQICGLGVADAVQTAVV